MRIFFNIRQGRNCTPRWIRFGNQLSLNGAQYLGVQAVADCLDLCLELSLCVAADYDSTMVDGCWLHMQPDDLLGNNTFNPPYSVAQYVVNRTCLSQSRRAFKYRLRISYDQ